MALLWTYSKSSVSFISLTGFLSACVLHSLFAALPAAPGWCRDRTALLSTAAAFPAHCLRFPTILSHFPFFSHCCPHFPSLSLFPSLFPCIPPFSPLLPFSIFPPTPFHRFPYFYSFPVCSPACLTFNLFPYFSTTFLHSPLYPPSPNLSHSLSPEFLLAFLYFHLLFSDFPFFFRFFPIFPFFPLFSLNFLSPISPFAVVLLCPSRCSQQHSCATALQHHKQPWETSATHMRDTHTQTHTWLCHTHTQSDTHTHGCVTHTHTHTHAE